MHHASRVLLGVVFVLAAGMGGHAVGELASKMAVDGIPHLFAKYLAAEGAANALRRSPEFRSL